MSNSKNDISTPLVIATTFTGEDILSNFNNSGGVTYRDYASEVFGIEQFKFSVSSAIYSFSMENWKAKNTGSDSYDPNSYLPQKIELLSSQGSKLNAVVLKGENWINEGHSFNVSNSDGTIEILDYHNNSSYRDSITGAGGNDVIRLFDYHNAGENGTIDDDISAHINRTEHFKNKKFPLTYVSKGTDTFDAFFQETVITLK